MTEEQKKAAEEQKKAAEEQKKAAEEKKKAYVKVKFLKTPPSEYALAYNLGEVGEVLADVAEKLIENKIASKA